MSFLGPHPTLDSAHPPRDSPDLAYLMSFVTASGGLGAYFMHQRRSVPGLIAGVAVSSLFAVGGWQIMNQEQNPNLQTTSGLPLGLGQSHETAHQLCLVGSLIFTGAMSYRDGSNPYAGPGGVMLAALGMVSAVYHGDKMLEWRHWEAGRVAEAERLLRGQYEDAKVQEETTVGTPPSTSTEQL